MNQRIRQETGISLIEVTIAMFVLAVGLLGIAPLIVLSIEANNMSEDTMVASNLARDKLEYLEGLDTIPASMFIQNETNVYTTYKNVNGVLLGSKTSIGFNRTTTIQNSMTDTLIPVGLLKVIVGINWVDKVGQPRQTSVTAYVQE